MELSVVIQRGEELFQNNAGVPALGSVLILGLCYIDLFFFLKVLCDTVLPYNEYTQLEIVFDSFGKMK